MTKIRICPKCKEAKLKNFVNISGWLAPNMYECTACGYVGPLYLEVDPKDFKLEPNEELDE